ncbi:MAG TPA: hypothetical protein ENI17_11645 [Pseudomonas xinjiangensis]|uniref:Uncharacterized protein n=2 Tax=root TaxID=1 RepID=A0A7V1BLA8_9GAMM|nr:hypothetical protein [Halopseudomonas xinjiangensis]HEC48266.1 hypothetical protein [Halopseudomonas xinjiangensis]
MPHVACPFWFKLAPALLLTALAGCAGLNVATVDRVPMTENQASIKANLYDCHAGYDALDTMARDRGTVDARYQRVEGLAHLRTSRFLASFDVAGLSKVSYQRWLMRQNAKAVEGLFIEWRRLRPASQQQLSHYWPGDQAAVKRALSDCGVVLVAHQAGLPRLTGMTTDDQYQNWKRWVGLYPLAALPFYLAVVNEHQALQQQQREFASAGAERAGQWTYYEQPISQPSPADALELLRRQPLDELGIPLLSPTIEHQLLNAFMPALAVKNTHSGPADNDRPAHLIADASGTIQRDTTQPTIYTHVSHGRYQGQVTLQLNYSVWFAERKAEHALDLLAGQFDGITWRVHLLPSGAVLGYDKMHQCGCWYQFFPARGFRSQPALARTQEPFNIGRTLHPEQRHTLWLASNTHHLLAVQAAKAPRSTQPLTVRPYAQLRALKSPGGRYYSPFDAQGLVPESRRLERLVFWPMGIPSPGAMRIHGTHAIAFIGYRHFDDPWLLDELGLD